MADARRKIPTRRRTSGSSSSRPRASHTMLKAQKYPSYHLPYAFLISRILEYKGVNVEGEHTQAIQAIGLENRETTSRQIRFVARGNIFLHKDEANQEDEDEDIDTHMTKLQFVNLSRQMEEMSMVHQTRHQELMEMHQSHHDYVCERLEDFDTRLENLENHFNLQPPDNPLTPPF
ncbi:hypothetical protein LR48_Vigan03g167700 [Vigna angularis]|uniref:Uncharacterized protein n=1 Tax=Phaseolus angularis TaxID=3914 RepID=A0A0L9U681_PHAAN|nr:hypothetical protein LR48_Vigan03g167700 [Vigna angularis]